MSRKFYKDEESYKKAKKKEYLRYYKSTQGYKKRLWTYEDDQLLIANTILMKARDLSELLQRSVKAIEHRKRNLRKRGLLPAVNNNN